MNNVLMNILKEYQNFDEVVSIAIGGSSAADTYDNISDIDIYVFVKSDISIHKREVLVKKYSSDYEVGGEYFGSGDEFFVDEIKQQLDIMYWNTNWFSSITENVWVKHYPQNGYTTAFLYTLNNFNIIYDTNNWLKNLQNSIKTEYPENLRQNIIKRNMMLLKDKPFASYYEQIQKAIKRGDLISVNHRLSAFLSSYFDIIFAVNKLLHPGEKRLIDYAEKHCKILPKNFALCIKNILKQPNENTLSILDEMITNLKDVINSSN